MRWRFALRGYPVNFSIQAKNLRRRQWPRRRAFPRTTARIPTRQSPSVLEGQENHSRIASKLRRKSLAVSKLQGAAIVWLLSLFWRTDRPEVLISRLGPAVGD